MAPWQSTLKKLSSIIPYLLKTGTLSDVTFLVGDDSNQKSFQAHRLLLAVRSDVFERMFFGALPEKGEEIKIPDIDPDIFEIVLKFVYEDELELKSMDTAVEILPVAYKYNITQLINLCHDYIKDHLNPNNVCSIYEIPMISNEQYFKSVCSEIITKSPEEVIKSEAFTEISVETVESILEIKVFNCVKQFLLFESLLKWAKAEFERGPGDESAKNLRQLMDPFLPKIKFLSMKSEEFTRGPAASGILTEGEIAKILTNICIPSSMPLPEWCKEGDSSKLDVSSLSLSSVKYLSFHQCLLLGRSVPIVKENCEINCNISVTGRSILMKGFIILGAISISSSVISFHINNVQQEVEKCSDELQKFHIVKKVEKLMFKQPFLLKTNNCYHIEVNIMRILGYCNAQLKCFDRILLSDGELFISYLRSSSIDKKELHFCELIYAECI